MPKFVLGIGRPDGGVTPDAVTEAIDRAMLAELDLTIKAATIWFEAYDYAGAGAGRSEFLELL